jgi:hypothetical protein
LSLSELVEASRELAGELEISWSIMWGSSFSSSCPQSNQKMKLEPQSKIKYKEYDVLLILWQAKKEKLCEIWMQQKKDWRMKPGWMNTGHDWSTPELCCRDSSATWNLVVHNMGQVILLIL